MGLNLGWGRLCCVPGQDTSLLYNFSPPRSKKETCTCKLHVNAGG